MGSQGNTYMTTYREKQQRRIPNRFQD